VNPVNPMQLWDQFVVQGLFVHALVFAYDELAALGVASWGVAIILFTIVVKSLTLPLTLKSLRSTRRMQKVQPLLQQLQKQHKNDKEKLMQEQMRLYKEHGVNPVAGCLPMLVQMPVWLALYGALSHLANDHELYPEFAKSFLWIGNLGQPEFKPENFPYQLPILAVLTAITQWVTTRMSVQPTTDPQQQSMNQVMQFMPLMFLFFSLNVPAGLVLYWVASNLYQMVQQYFITGWGALRPSAAVAVAGGATPVRAASARRADDAEPEAVEQGAPRATQTPSNSGRRRRNKRR
jgi:YidC/Oxa1 family membrane protein insertase